MSSNLLTHLQSRKLYVFRNYGLGPGQQPEKLGSISGANDFLAVFFDSRALQPDTDYFLNLISPKEQQPDSAIIELGQLDFRKEVKNTHLYCGKRFQVSFATAQKNTNITLDRFKGVCIINEKGNVTLCAVEKLWQRPSIIHPSILGTLSQMHRWVFGAFAELIHNSIEAGSKNIWITMGKRFNIPLITLRDDGHGMSPIGLHQMLTFGKAVKVR